MAGNSEIPAGNLDVTIIVGALKEIAGFYLRALTEI